MSTKYKFADNDRLYFISFAVVNWIDLFTRNEYKDILLDSWRFCIKEKGLRVFSWCIMTNHVHMIIGTNADHPLSKTIGEMKRHTSIKLRESITNNGSESRREWILWMMERAGRKNSNNADFQLWQQDNHPFELSNHKLALQKINYIHTNPVKAGIVSRPEDYLYSSARDYCGEPGLLEELEYLG